MHYIYHIPERKEWGCTNNLKRRLCQLKYKMEQVDRVITCGNVDMASELEKNMNLQYGYQWNDSRYYSRVLKMHSTENRIKGGSIGGKIGGIKAGQIAKSTGQIYELSKNSSKRIIAINLSDNSITQYESIHSASKNITGASASKICLVCKGKRKTHMNYKFEYIK